jgi:nickel transport protein
MGKVLQVMIRLSLPLLAALVTMAPPVQAHRVLVFAHAEGETIHTESKFVPDTPVRQGKVMVQEANTGEVLLTGHTDDRGKFSFPIPAAARDRHLDLKIVVEAAMGHRGEWLLKAENYLPGAKAAPAAATAAAPTPPAPVSKGSGPEAQALETAINQALERQLAPIKEMLTQLTVRRTSFTDIMGGIGYIVGLFGLWAYFAGRKRKDS